MPIRATYKKIFFLPFYKLQSYLLPFYASEHIKRILGRYRQVSLVLLLFIPHVCHELEKNWGGNEVDMSAIKQDLNDICLSKEVLTINQLVHSLNSGFTRQ